MLCACVVEDELPEIYTKNPSQVELGSDSDFDPEYLDYLKKILVKNKRQKNGKRPKQFIIPQEEESENYVSTFEDKVIDIEPVNEENFENSENTCIEEIFENEIVNDTFNEQRSEINQKQQIKTRENVENYNNSESEEFRPPPEPPPPNSKSTGQILPNKNIVECRDQLTMRNNNYVYFVTANETTRDNGSKSLEKRGTLPKFKNLQKGTAKEIKKEN